MSKNRKIAIIGSVVLGTVVFSVLFVHLGNRFFPREDVPTIKEGSVIAESWIRNFSSSHPLYGKDLQLVHTEEIARGEYRFLFTFTTDDPVYGVHQNEIEIKTKNIEVISAVTNGIYDEIAKKYLEEKTTVDIYLVVEREGEEEEREREVVAVKRVISTSAVENVKEVLLAEVLSGPTEKEKEEGYLTFIKEGTNVLSFRVGNRVAYIELSTSFDEQPEIAQEQIRKTLAQLDDISEVKVPERKTLIVLEIEGVPENFLFTRELSEGSQGQDVKYLQIILNASPDTMVAQQGPGSPGEEATSFGQSTTRAVMVFQRKYAEEILEPAGMILSTGVVDEHTRDKLNAILEESRW